MHVLRAVNAAQHALHEPTGIVAHAHHRPNSVHQSGPLIATRLATRV